MTKGMVELKLAIEEMKAGRKSPPKKANIILAEMDAQAMRRAVNGLPMKEFICEACGKPFLASPRRKNLRCDRCLNRTKTPEEKDAVPEESCQNEAARIAHEARACGKTYGQHCAKAVLVRVPEGLMTVRERDAAAGAGYER